MLRKIMRNKVKNEIKSNRIQQKWNAMQYAKYGIKKLTVMRFRCNGFKHFELK